MCGFKAGDEATCIWDRRKRGEPWGVYFKSLILLHPGRTYTVAGTRAYLAGLGLSLSEVADPTRDSLWNSLFFRKVIRRDLTAWLATENTIDNPNPIRRRKRADA